MRTSLRCSGGSRGSWLSEVVLPTVIVGVILIISLFAVIVLLMIRRHFGSPGHDVDGPYVVHHTPMDAGAQVLMGLFFMSKVYLYTARATTAEKVQFGKKRRHGIVLLCSNFDSQSRSTLHIGPPSLGHLNLQTP